MDGQELPGYEGEDLTDPDRSQWIYNVDQLPNGTHALKAVYEECGYLLASGPVESSVTVGADGVAPTGSIEINGGDEYTNNTHIYLVTPATDDASDVKQVAFSDDGANWAIYSYALHHGWDIDPTAGEHTVYAKFSDAFDNWSEVVTDSIIYDHNPPSVDPPGELFVQGSTIIGGKVTVEVPINTNDNGSGVADFDLNQKTGSGAWKDVPVPPAAAVSEDVIDRLLATQKKYTFRARATGSAANPSPRAVGPAVNIRTVQDSSARIIYRNGWKVTKNSAYWGGAAKTATKDGATARIAISGTSIALVSTTGPGRGEV